MFFSEWQRATGGEAQYRRKAESNGPYAETTYQIFTRALLPPEQYTTSSPPHVMV